MYDGDFERLIQTPAFDKIDLGGIQRYVLVSPVGLGRKGVLVLIVPKVLK